MQNKFCENFRFCWWNRRVQEHLFTTKPAEEVTIAGGNAQDLSVHLFGKSRSDVFKAESVVNKRWMVRPMTTESNLLSLFSLGNTNPNCRVITAVDALYSNGIKEGVPTCERLGSAVWKRVGCFLYLYGGVILAGNKCSQGNRFYFRLFRVCMFVVSFCSDRSWEKLYFPLGEIMDAHTRARQRTTTRSFGGKSDNICVTKKERVSGKMVSLWGEILLRVARPSGRKMDCT